MKCHNCGFELENERVCPVCGAQVELPADAGAEYGFEQPRFGGYSEYDRDYYFDDRSAKKPALPTLIIIILLCITAVASCVTAVFGFLNYRQNQKYEKYFDAAQKLVERLNEESDHPLIIEESTPDDAPAAPVAPVGAFSAFAPVGAFSAF